MNKEHPIIFSTDMVKAILDGRKTMTRRTNKLNKFNENPSLWHIRTGVNCWFADSIELNKYHLPSQQIYIKCPYGQVGDRLWVRETFGIDEDDQIVVFYKAETSDWGGKWKPSIHMFRKDSRITLEITELRVERLQEINLRDIKFEGVWTYEDPYKGKGLSIGQCRMKFARLWDSFNAKRGYGWDMNPWVWAISFKKINGGDAIRN